MEYAGLIMIVVAVVVGIVAVVFGIGAAAVAIGNAVERMAQKRQQRQADILALRLLDLEHQETMRKRQ